MRNFGTDEVTLINVAGKPLPFRGKYKYQVKSSDVNTICKVITKPPTKTVVLDDAQYVMAFEFFDRAKEIGYQKFIDIGVNFRKIVNAVINDAPDDVVVYFMQHVETTNEGKVKAKTIGKMLDEKLTVEGLFSVVLMCNTDGKRHWFSTQSDGSNTVKSPIGMFEEVEIDNDLKVVDEKIREYWEIQSNN
jgi:hypothetical protein